MDGRDPILSVEHLRTHFLTRAGVAKAVDDVSFTLARGEVMGLVGESGSGKSVTGYSIIGLVDAPGEVVGGQVRFDGEDMLRASEARLRQLRGNRIAMIFQDAMMTLNPVLRIDTQMVEAVRVHENISRRAGARWAASSPVCSKSPPAACCTVVWIERTSSVSGRVKWRSRSS